MIVASWNVNSIRIRLDGLKYLSENYQPDIICLQEIKAENNSFPADEVSEIGYKYQYVNGMKSYNGVAILSKVPLTNVEIINFATEYTKKFIDGNDCRHISATLPDGSKLHNFYVPAGGDVPDIEVNVKFAHKLQFLADAKEYFTKNHNNSDKLILVGDLNIAPLASDVWSHKQLRKVVSHTEIEIDALERLRLSNDWHDCYRSIVGNEKQAYSWWSYRAKDWAKSNRGRRLDHIWATKPLIANLINSEIVTHIRGMNRPSDHCAILVEFKT